MAVNESTPLISHGCIAPARDKEKLSDLPWYVCLIAACATINSVNLGFDIGVNSGVGLLIQRDMKLSDWELGVFMGSIHFVAAFGALRSHELTDRLGRRRCFCVAQIIFLVGIAILCFAQSYAHLLLSRLFLGIAIGVSLALGPLYISELAPAAHRGNLTTWSEIAINAGILIGFIVNWIFADLPRGVNWRVMIACGALLPCVLIVFSLTVMPESPRWLIGRGHLSEAKQVLIWTHPPGEDVDALVSGIRKQADTDAEYIALGWTPLLRPDEFTRRMMLVGIGVAFAQQATGIESVVMYSPEIFEQAGVATTVRELFFVTVVVGVVKTFCIFISASFLDGWGRRPMLLWSMAGTGLSMLLLSVSFGLGLATLAAVAVMLYVGFFSLGIGPICWLFASEVFPLRIRGKAMSVAATVNRLVSGLVALTFLPLANFLGYAGYFLLFAVVIAIALVVQYLTVPETKGLTLEEASDTIFKDS
eukprot:TRINITY_DN33931_c0_g1_i1.p1 TRINITY_DN33931_c0_g1~~TRINITY_DN33931_c0_g1_i1.p1  ORF type:complete len:477 (+),score=47.72 TRINITY_DN33931_c0_g1_i1:61-1491(+)